MLRMLILELIIVLNVEMMSKYLRQLKHMANTERSIDFLEIIRTTSKEQKCLSFDKS